MGVITWKLLFSWGELTFGEREGGKKILVGESTGGAGGGIFPGGGKWANFRLDGVTFPHPPKTENLDEAWSNKKKKHEKIKAYRKSVYTGPTVKRSLDLINPSKL